MNWSEFAAQLSIALIPVIAAGVTGLLGVAIAYLSAKVKQQFGEQAKAKADAYLDMLRDAADSAVVAVQQSTVDRLKAAGKWNDETAKSVKAEAVRIALASLGALQDKAARQLILDVPRYMESLVEVALRELKRQAPTNPPTAQG